MDLPRRAFYFHGPGMTQMPYSMLGPGHPRRHVIEKKPLGHHAINLFTTVVILGAIYYLFKSNTTS